jgi:hypothetical protein
MKAVIRILSGVAFGMLVMFFLRPYITEPRIIEKIKIVKQVQYKTRWNVNKEIEFEQAKNCVFSPIIIDTQVDKNKMRILAQDDCKITEKDIEIDTDESYTEEVLIGAGALILGFTTGIILF